MIKKILLDPERDTVKKQIRKNTEKFPQNFTE